MDPFRTHDKEVVFASGGGGLRPGFTRTTVIELFNPIMLAVHLRTAGLRPPQPPHFFKLYKATPSIILPAKTEPIWPLSERVIKTSCEQMGGGAAPAAPPPPPISPAFLFTPCRFAFKNVVPSTRTVSKTHHAGRWGAAFPPPNSRAFEKMCKIVSSIILPAKTEPIWTLSEPVIKKIYNEPEQPNEGACLRYKMNRSRQVRGPYLRCMMNRNRQMKGGGVFKIYDEPESPYEGAC